MLSDESDDIIQNFSVNYLDSNIIVQFVRIPTTNIIHHYAFYSNGLANMDGQSRNIFRLALHLIYDSDSILGGLLIYIKTRQLDRTLLHSTNGNSWCKEVKTGGERE